MIVSGCNHKSGDSNEAPATASPDAGGADAAATMRNRGPSPAPALPSAEILQGARAGCGRFEHYFTSECQEPEAGPNARRLRPLRRLLGSGAQLHVASLRARVAIVL